MRVRVYPKLMVTAARWWNHQRGSETIQSGAFRPEGVAREVALHARGKESGRVTFIEQELGGSSHMGEPEFSDSTLRWMRMGDNIILCNGGIDTLDFHRAPNCLYINQKDESC
jgi:hypothetical protein